MPWSGRPVDTYGSLDCALKQCRVMDAIFPGDPIDYAKQKDLVMSRIDEATDAYWDVVMRVNATGTFRSMPVGAASVPEAAARRCHRERGLGGGTAGLRRNALLCGQQARGQRADEECRHRDYAPFGIRVNLGLYGYHHHAHV